MKKSIFLEIRCVVSLGKQFVYFNVIIEININNISRFDCLLSEYRRVEIIRQGLIQQSHVMQKQLLRSLSRAREVGSPLNPPPPGQQTRQTNMSKSSVQGFRLKCCIFAANCAEQFPKNRKENSKTGWEGNRYFTKWLHAILGNSLIHLIVFMLNT